VFDAGQHRRIPPAMKLPNLLMPSLFRINCAKASERPIRPRECRFETVKQKSVAAGTAPGPLMQVSIIDIPLNLAARRKCLL
jgi:hypothetical protein